MNIAIFSDTYLPKIDGVVKFVTTASDYLVGKGHRVAIFCPKYPGHKDDISNHLQVFRFSSFSLPSYRDVKVTLIVPKTVERLLRAFHPDVVHINTPGPVGKAGAIAAHKLGIPLIGTYHTLVSEQMSYLTPRQLLGINRLMEWMTGTNYSAVEFLKNEGSLLKKLGWWISWMAYRPCDLVLAPSRAICRLLKTKYPSANVLAHSNGIDLKGFPRKRQYPTAGRFQFIYVGRISFEKSVDVVIQALAQVIKKKGVHLYLDIVGEGPARHSLERMVAKEGLEAYVRFFGRMSTEELSARYRSADAFITASAMETQGIVLLEAMASGLPIVGVRKYAIPDLVEEGANGFLAEPYDSNALAKAIWRLIENRSKIKQLGDASYRKVKGHRLELWMGKLERIYRAMSSSSSSSGRIRQIDK